MSNVPDIQNSEWVKSQLAKLEMVEWDRFTAGQWGEVQSVSVYGWIERETDEYKDFVLLILWPEDENLYFTTSSERYTREIDRILFGEDDDAEHNPCHRVEDAFDLPNMVELQSGLTEFAGGDDDY